MFFDIQNPSESSLTSTSEQENPTTETSYDPSPLATEQDPDDYTYESYDEESEKFSPWSSKGILKIKKRRSSLVGPSSFYRSLVSLPEAQDTFTEELQNFTETITFFTENPYAFIHILIFLSNFFNVNYSLFPQEVDLEDDESRSKKHKTCTWTQLEGKLREISQFLSFDLISSNQIWEELSLSQSIVDIVNLIKKCKDINLK